ncbi:MAG: hypothetical protein R3255_09675 [Candidatus Lokiarchaeia archaeon]|nr:hypothetical protein [Candidatus Lokiarchaeia archaeon]
MKELDKIDKYYRNLALIIVGIGILLLIIWLVIFFNIPHTTMPLLMSIAIALLIAGILLFTRIQYIIWMKKKY